MNIDAPADYPDKIRAIRLREKLTQSQFADVIGVSYVTVNRWENAQSQPSSSMWQKIVRAEMLGMDAFKRAADAPSVVRESGSTYSVLSQAPPLDFSGDPEKVRVVAEGYRLTYGHLFNPAFATETSLIDPLPHQRLAVYEHMLNQPRLRFLLADDAGAGKTIMAGLYMREMLARRLIRRVLIVPPAGLAGNWNREMRSLFNLPFRMVAGSEARSENPFTGPDSNQLIVSIDTLAGERMFARLQDPAVAPYDLVIFDEAHKLSANREPDFRIRKTDRYRLAEAIAGASFDDPRWSLSWSSNHLLLLTATPHMGKDYPYYCLWRLLEPEVLSTYEAFAAYPSDARQRHFIRRTKEEMVRYDGTPIYPRRISDTLSYDLTQGSVSEQRLYDETTAYIRTYYNRAKILNRSAARLAMSIFQRRLASSTYALTCSFENRIKKLDNLIADIESGKLSPRELTALQNRLEPARNVFDDMTADEEGAEDGQEQNETFEDTILAGLVATSLAELQAERSRLEILLHLAHQVYGDESKFEKLRDILRNPQYANEKIIIFTEHRDTLTFLVRQLEKLGFTGHVAAIHGGLSNQPNLDTGLSERDEQVEFFRRPASEGGATYLVATDAAGEGINLQFCWLMVNYDIPWNPARLEQRMGRIHRYGQKHDPVVILNLLAGKTREGRVLKTLLDKLERIRKELGSDKVFDVIGRLFEGVSLTDYMEQATTEEGARASLTKVEGTLTKEQVEALERKDHQLFGDGGDIRSQLSRLRTDIDQEVYRRLLPGYVRRFVEKSAPLVHIGIEGNLDEVFSMRPLSPGALDLLWSVLETYPSEVRSRLTVYRPPDASKAIFLHPGDRFFDRFAAYVQSQFEGDALRGGVFVDPTTSQPYLLHLVLLSVERQADPTKRTLEQAEPLEYRLIGLRQDESGEIRESPVEYLLLLRGGPGMPAATVGFAANATGLLEIARRDAAERVSRGMAEAHRQSLLRTLAEREDFLRRGYDYQTAELAAARARLTEKAQAGDARAKGELTKIKERQRTLGKRRDEAIAILQREPELVAPGEIDFLAHALVVPSSDPEERRRHDDEIEAAAVQVVWAYEEARGAAVRDVSTPALARAAGLIDNPGFDLLSRRPDGEERPIEVKGRAGVGDVELSENEWIQACNHRDRYWLYAVFDCATSHPRLMRVRDPFGVLLARARGGVIIDQTEIFKAAENAG